LQAVRDDPQVLRRRLGATQLDLVEKGSAEVVTGDGRQAQPEFLPCLPNPPSERTRRCGVIR
jgi:hypothetical protein